MLPVLALFLQSADPHVQESVATAIARLADGSQLHKDALIRAISLLQMPALLTSNQPRITLLATTAMWCLSEGSQQNADDIIAAIVVPALVALLRSAA